MEPNDGKKNRPLAVDKAPGHRAPGELPPASRAFSSNGDFVTGCAVGLAILAWAYLHFKAGWPWFTSSLPSLLILAAAVTRLIFQIRRSS